jgi:hypothetical protein
MDEAHHKLQKRNVEVFDHEGAVVAGTSLSLISSFLPRLAEMFCRVLAIWYSPVGRVLPILERICRY